MYVIVFVYVYIQMCVCVCVCSYDNKNKPTPGTKERQTHELGQQEPQACQNKSPPHVNDVNGTLYVYVCDTAACCP